MRLDEYRDCVIGGSGAFMVPAASYDTFADAILKKLITEIAATAKRNPPRSVAEPRDQRLDR
jgi:Protein of unknown function (DUF1194)